ncbi:hypothetical protein [Pseudomonas phage vB_Pae_CF63a]|nr:hypothetical protein [Pseudomonas phage vB_Pae_CF63a]
MNRNFKKPCGAVAPPPNNRPCFGLLKMEEGGGGWATRVPTGAREGSPEVGKVHQVATPLNNLVRVGGNPPVGPFRAPRFMGGPAVLGGFFMGPSIFPPRKTRAPKLAFLLGRVCVPRKSARAGF